MPEQKKVNYRVNDIAKLNTLPFIENGGLFIPTEAYFTLNEMITINLILPEKDSLPLEGRVIWIAQADDLQETAGIGVQFTSPEALSIIS